LYNSTLYGFTYDDSNPVGMGSYTDLLIYDSANYNLQVRKIQRTNSSIERAFYKTVAKDTKIVEDLKNGVGVYSIWTKNEEPELLGYYDIYIAATLQNDLGKNIFLEYFLDPNDYDYYVAKFSTKYNYTEWYRQSEFQGLNETVRGLYYDKNYQVVFIAVEIPSNTYMKAS
jgi:hypothetical protein